MMNVISAFKTHNSLLQLKLQFSMFWSEWIFNWNSSSYKINQEQNSLSLWQNLALNSISSLNQKKLNTLTQIFTLISHYFFVWLISFSHLRFWSNLLSHTAILLCVMFFLRSLSFALLFHHILSSCLRFQSSSLLQAVIWSHAAFSEKIFVCILKFQKYKFF